MTVINNDDGTLPMQRDSEGRSYLPAEVESALLATGASSYVQAEDPGAVGAGKFWLDASGNFYVRNVANDGWIEVVSVD